LPSHAFPQDGLSNGNGSIKISAAPDSMLIGVRALVNDVVMMWSRVTLACINAATVARNPELGAQRGHRSVRDEKRRE